MLRLLLNESRLCAHGVWFLTQSAIVPLWNAAAELLPPAKTVVYIYELSVLLSNYYCVRRAIDLPRQVRDKREGTSGTKDAVFAPSSLLNVFPTLSPEQKKENRNATATLSLSQNLNRSVLVAVRRVSLFS